jgi:hypothetical protein
MCEEVTSTDHAAPRNGLDFLANFLAPEPPDAAVGGALLSFANFEFVLAKMEVRLYLSSASALIRDLSQPMRPDRAGTMIGRGSTIIVMMWLP